LKPSIELGRKFLEFPNLKLLNVKRSIVLRAQELMEKYEIKPRDAIHATTALENGIEIIVNAIKLRSKHHITYFDSLHAASALSHDKTIISTGRVYKDIPKLKAMNPREALKQ